jgi:hypothetical protein
MMILFIPINEIKNVSLICHGVLFYTCDTPIFEIIGNWSIALDENSNEFVLLDVLLLS